MNHRPELLDEPILARLGSSKTIEWVSPRSDDSYAEYRDAAFLERLGVGDLSTALADFWPQRGPQWDALGRSSDGDLLLVEAKAHIAEMFSPPTQAGPQSLAVIERALKGTADRLHATPKAAWAQCFFQYANRLAHLDFLRQHERPAWLVLVSFVGDPEVAGPKTAEAWTAAYAVMDHVMGLRADHGLSRYVIHIHPDVAELA